MCLRVWIPQAEALSDIHATDTDAQSYRDHTPMAVLSFASMIKSRHIHRLVETIELPSLPCVCWLMVRWHVRLQPF